MENISKFLQNFTFVDMIFKSTFLCPYQYFIFIAWKSFFQILYTAHYCIMNFFSSSKTEPAVSYNIKIFFKRS